MTTTALQTTQEETQDETKQVKRVGNLTIMRRLAHCAYNQRAMTIATPLLVLGEVVFEILIPYRTAELIDTVRRGADLAQIFEAGWVLVVMSLISLAFGAAAGLTCAKASCGFAHDLRRDMFGNIQTFSFEVIDRFSNSSLVTRLTTDVTNVQNAFMQIIRVAVRSPFLVIAAFAAAWSMNSMLSLLYLILMPLVAIALFGIIVRVLPIFHRIFRRYDALNESAEENLSGIRVVKSYVREDHERSRFGVAAERVASDFTHVERIIALNIPILNLCVYVIFTFIIYAGSYLIVSSRGIDLDVGQFSSLISYGFMMLMGLMMLTTVFAQVAIAEEGAHRIYEVLEAKTTIEPPAEPVYEVADGSVDFTNVGFSYAANTDRMALSGIDLHIKSGEVIGIIGSTGSGKSSLVQLIARLYDTTTGTVSVGGRDVRDYDLDTLRHEVAMVLQKNVLFSGTIAENLRWGNPEATDDEVKEAARLACADEFVQQFPNKYDTHIEQGGTNVSGGQRQRLCIARALLARPKVLILDDSTSAVDTRTDRAIREGLRSYLPGTTKIIIAQRTGSVEDADRIVVMDRGTINAVGTHEELLRTNEIYREVYLSQNKKSHDERHFDGEEEATNEH